MQRIGIIKGRGPSLGRRTVAFILFAWVPLLLFATLEGYAIGSTPRASFLLDFATYARFFIGVPLLFAAEIVVGPRIRAAGLRFIESGIVQLSDHPAFLAATARARRRRDAALPELLFLVAALFGAWFLTIEQLGGLDATTWHAVLTPTGSHLLPGGTMVSLRRYTISAILSTTVALAADHLGRFSLGRVPATTESDRHSLRHVRGPRVPGGRSCVAIDLSLRAELRVCSGDRVSRAVRKHGYCDIAHDGPHLVCVFGFR